MGGPANDHLDNKVVSTTSQQYKTHQFKSFVSIVEVIGGVLRYTIFFHTGGVQPSGELLFRLSKPMQF